MARPAGLLQWQQTVSTYVPHLSQPQLTVLGLWSFGMVLAQTCGLTTVAITLAYVLGCSEQTIREQLRDWYRDARHKSGAKRGRKRRSLEVTLCFAPLLGWVVAWTDAACRHLALAMDASTRGQRFTILSISVVVRGWAIPVAWRVVEATQPGAWRPHWEALLGHLQGSVPPDWTVIVLADRGLYARWLFRTMQALGWHPFLRINRQGHYRVPTAATSRPLTQVVSRVGQRWAGPVICFTTPARPLPCTLLARWEAGYRDPWLILTDLPPTTVDIAWYGLRAWIECGFKDSKRGGWHWEPTKMRDPARAERLWLAVAVATLWTVSVGCQAEVGQPTPQLARLAEHHIARKRATGQRPARALSCFRRGRLVIVAGLCLGQPVPVGSLRPEPWPTSAETTGERHRVSPPRLQGQEREAYTCKGRRRGPVRRHRIQGGPLLGCKGPHRRPRDTPDPPWCCSGAARPQSNTSPGPCVTAALSARAIVQAYRPACAPGKKAPLPTDSATTAPPRTHGHNLSRGDASAVTTPLGPRPGAGGAPGPRQR